MDDEGNRSKLTEVHRVLLTYIRSCKYIQQEKLQNDFQLIQQRLSQESQLETVDSLLDKHIVLINTSITQHGFKIDRRTHEISGDLYYIFINTLSDEIIKSNTNYSVKELDAVKTIIDDIIESKNFAIGRVNAQQRISNILNKTLRDSSSFIDKLIDDGWFTLSREEKLLLSMKSLCELKHYLIDRHGIFTPTSKGKLYMCKQCNEMVTMGYKGEDGLSFHYKCYNIYTRAGGEEARIPSDYDIIGLYPDAI